MYLFNHNELSFAYYQNIMIKHLIFLIHVLLELPYFYPDGFNQYTCLLYKDSPGTPSRAAFSAMEKYEDPKDSFNSPALPWDLVQN